MKKKGLLLVIALLALSGLMAAMAYNKAVVTNNTTLRVNSTYDSLVSLRPVGGVGNKDLTAEIIEGSLVFRLGQGIKYEDELRGFQRNSRYIWDNMFEIFNRSNEKVQLSMKATGVPAGVTILINDQDITNKHAVIGTQASGNTQRVKVEIQVAPGAQLGITTGIEIEVISNAID